MDTKTIKFASFKMDDFMGAITEHLKSVIGEGADPQSAICVVEEDGRTPNWGEEDPDRDILEDIKEGKKVFFPFSDCGAAEPISCADGTEISNEWDEDDESEEECDIPIGEADVVGFLLWKNKDELSIDFGIHFGGSCSHPPCAEIYETGVFEDLMKKFIGRFIV